MTKELLQQALDALNHSVRAFGKICPSSTYAQDVMDECEVSIEELEAALSQPVQLDVLPVIGMRDGKYLDSTPKLNVGNSSFEDWYAHEKTYTGDKQLARDAYAAGMGDPLVTYAQPVQPMAYLVKPNELSHPSLQKELCFHPPIARSDWNITPLYAESQMRHAGHPRETK